MPIEKIMASEFAKHPTLVTIVVLACMGGFGWATKTLAQKAELTTFKSEVSVEIQDFKADVKNEFLMINDRITKATYESEKRDLTTALERKDTEIFNLTQLEDSFAVRQQVDKYKTARKITVWKLQSVTNKLDAMDP